MNPFCHGEERSDVAIQLESRWIATPSFLGLAMTNLSRKYPAKDRIHQSIL
jgi:hypothetical protein